MKEHDDNEEPIERGAFNWSLTLVGMVLGLFLFLAEFAGKLALLGLLLVILSVGGSVIAKFVYMAWVWGWNLIP